MAHAFGEEEVDLEEEVTQQDLDNEFRDLVKRGYVPAHALEIMGVAS